MNRWLPDITLLRNSPELQNKLITIYRNLPENARNKIEESWSSKLSSFAKLDIGKQELLELLILNSLRYHNHKILDKYKIPFIFLPRTFYYAENSAGDKLYLLYSLGISYDQNVYLCYLCRKGEIEPTRGFLDSIPRENLRVMKWSDIHNTTREIENWLRCIELGIPHPEIELDFKFFGFYTIVSKPLRKSLFPIKFDNKMYVELGVQILSILQKLHKIGCHSDIKPDNIMCEISSSGRPIYYLIDLGGMTTNKIPNGYCRIIYSWHYTCQDPKNGILTTYKHDLIELAYTLNILFRKCYNIKCKHKHYREMVPRSIIAKFMDYVMSIDERHISDTHYDRLRDILLHT